MSEARDLAEAHIRAFNERTWDRAAEIYAPDLITVEPGRTTRGIDAFVGRGQGFAAAFPDSRMEVTAIIESGSHTVAEGVYTGTHTRAAGHPARRGPAHRPYPAAAHLPRLRGSRRPDYQQPRLLRPDDPRRPARPAARAGARELSTQAAGTTEDPEPTPQRGIRGRAQPDTRPRTAKPSCRSSRRRARADQRLDRGGHTECFLFVSSGLLAA
jgi:hypothetical protein